MSDICSLLQSISTAQAVRIDQIVLDLSTFSITQTMDLSSWPKANFSCTLMNSKNVLKKIPPIMKCTVMDQQTVYIFSGTPGELGVKLQLHLTWLVHNQPELGNPLYGSLSCIQLQCHKYSKAINLGTNWWCNGNIATCQLMTGRS